MRPKAVTDKADRGRDTMEWLQIFKAHGMVSMMLLIVVLAQRSSGEDRDTGFQIATAIVTVIVALAALLRRPLKSVHRHLFSSRPHLEDGLQWIAIAVLVLLSVLTILYTIVFLPAIGSV